MGVIILGQADVIEFLKQNPNEWFTAEKIKERMKCGNIYKTISKLKQFQLVEVERERTRGNGTMAHNIYRHKK